MTDEPTRVRLERLAWKYRVLAELRARREELSAAGRAGFDEAEGITRRDAFRQVAREFPGALRELDGSTAQTLAARAAAVERAIAGGPVAPWMLVVMDFHEVLREALAAKLWLARHLGRDGTVDEATVAAYRASTGAAPADLATWLARVRHPAKGRVLSLVWDELERRHGEPRATLAALVFGTESA